MLIRMAIVILLGLPAVLFPSTLLTIVRGVLEAHPALSLQAFGLGLGSISHFLLKRAKTYRFLCTHQHEHAHLLFSILMFVTPHGFASSADHGGVYQGERPTGPFSQTRQFLIAIAPYWFSPLVIIPLVVLALSPPRESFFRFLLTFLTGLALVHPLTQIHRGQPDLKEHGVLPSLAASTWLWAAQTVLLIEMIRVRSLGVTVEVYEMACRLLIPG